MAIGATLDRVDHQDAKRPLSVREAQFVGMYQMTGCNGAEAMRRLGYGGTQPDVAASKYMARPWVQKAISDALRERSAKVDISIDRIAAEYAQMAFAAHEGPLTASHKLGALDALGKFKGMFKPDQATVIPITFNFIGGPPLSDAPQVIDHAAKPVDSAAILGPDKAIPR